MDKKTYVPKSSGKAIQFNDGGQIIKLSFEVRTLIEFAQNHQNEGGWLNLICAERREPGDKGKTHYLYLDTWKPERRGEQRMSQPTPKPTEPIQSAPEEDDVPF